MKQSVDPAWVAGSVGYCVECHVTTGGCVIGCSIWKAASHWPEETGRLGVKATFGQSGFIFLYNQIA